MMNHETSRAVRSALPFVAFVAITALIGVYTAQLDPAPDRATSRHLTASSKMENPEARALFDWMRFRDPKTKTIPSGIRTAELEFARTLPAREPKFAGSLAKGAASAWVSRGPVNQGGRTRALAIDLSNENHILAGGVSGGMWRSTDGGASWSRATSLSEIVQSVTCIAQDPRPGQTSVWYYGTGEKLGNSAAGPDGYHGDGMFKSTDGGASWSQLPSTVGGTPQSFDRTFDYVWTVLVHPSDGSVIAALYGEILKSTDGGTSWASLLDSGNPKSEFTDVTVTSTGVLYATMSSDGAVKGIYRSTDIGATWANITPPTWPSTYRRVVLSHAPSNENVVYFLAETPGSGFLYTESDGSTYHTSLFKYSYVSGDGSGSGGTWENRSANIPGFGGQVGDFNHQGSYDLDIAVLPTNEHTVFIGGTNLYRSTDGFATTGNTAWIGGYATTNNVSQYANHHPDQHALVFYPSNATVALSGHDGGISRTADILATNVAWELRNAGYITSQFYSVAIDMATAGNPVIIGGLQDNGNLFTGSADGSVGWREIPGGGDGTFSAIADNRTAYYIGQQNGTIYKERLDAQGVEEAFATVTPAGATGFLFVTPYLLDPANTDRMYLAVDDKVWRNSDLSGILFSDQVGSTPNDKTTVNWSTMTNSAVPGENVTALEASTAPAGRLYYGTNNAKVFRIDGADAGDPVPTNISSPMFTAGAYVSSIAANPRNADTAVVVFSNYSAKSLFLTTDGGTSWSDIGGNLEQNPDGSGNGPSCRWATILPEAGGVRVYVATSTGVYSTGLLNGASTVWEQEGATTVGNVVVTMVRSRPADNLVVAATHANGIYSTTAIPTSVEERGENVPGTYGLEPNYPNPFNPSTTIGYVIREAGLVRLTVFDASGRRITTLVNEVMAAGRHEAVWNGLTHAGNAVASGTYFYRLDADGIRQTRRMTLLK